MTDTLQVIDTRTQLAGADDITARLMMSYIRYSDNSLRTKQTYLTGLKQFYRFLAENNIKDPTETDVIDFRDYLRATGHKPTTIQSYIMSLKQLYAWGQRKGFCTTDIASEVKNERITKAHKKDALSPEQVKRVLSLIDTSTLTGKRDYAIILLTVTCALRVIENIRADIKDLTSDGNRAILWRQGKGHTDKDEPMPVCPEAEAAIRDYLKARGEKNTDAPLFVSLSNHEKNSRLTTRSLSRIIKERFKAAGIDSERYTAHSLRHTGITLAMRAEKDITKVQRFAGHSSVETTMIYIHEEERLNNTCTNSVAAAIFS